MSQIPRLGGGRPPIKSTTTTSTKIPGGSKTITRTCIRELKPAGCQDCPGAQTGQSMTGKTTLDTSRSRQPGTSGIRPPSQIRSTRINQNVQSRKVASTAKAPLPQLRPALPGQYNVPAPYGPMSRQGKEMTYSSPGSLRGQMELRVPKELKYDTIKVDPGAGARDRRALPGTTLADTFAGNFSVYGGPGFSEEMADRSELNARLNQTAAEELLNMSSPEVNRVEQSVAQELMEKSMMDPQEQVYAKGQETQNVKRAPMIQTPAGMEPIIQQTYTEKRVERDGHGETIVKNLAVTDINEATGAGTRITMSQRQMNPEYGLSSDGRDVIRVKETISVTKSYVSTAKDVVHETITPKVDIDPAELAQMVEDESHDVENTLKMAPPDLTLKEDSYSIKKRLQRLRLNTESMVLLQESIIHSAPTADEALADTPPEALANIMHTVESGVTPECPPDQIFHSLFEEKSTEQSVILSSIGPGPLQDVVVPQLLTKDIHKESMTNELTDLTNIFKNVTDANSWPPVDIFESVMNEEAKSPKNGIKSRKFKPLKDEEMPWAEEDLEPMVNIVGAEPAVVLDPANVPELETSGNLEQEMTQGIEYFVDADPVQYMSRVQLRGTLPPPWFPGYIYCLPEFPDVVKLARNPDEVFISSWRSCQPRLIPETSMSILH